MATNLCGGGGGDDIIDHELYAGTAKSMEGVLADECYQQAKDEGCVINTVWQDGDSSSAKSVMKHHPAAKVYKCGGHVGRAFSNSLKEAAKKKEFSADVKQKYKEKFPLIETAKCRCTRHKSGCGCLSDAFIKGARINHFCVLQQCYLSLAWDGDLAPVLTVLWRAVVLAPVLDLKVPIVKAGGEWT